MQVVGVDVGGTKIRAALARSPDWVPEVEHEVATHPAGGEAVVGQIVDAVRRVAGADLAEVAAIGMGTPGTVDPATGHTRLSQNITGLDDLDLPGLLARELGRPVRVQNDANLAAVAEWWRGRATGHDDVVVVSVGTGIGGGVISGGRLLQGAHGGAGELADLPLAGDPFDRAAQAAGVLEGQVGTHGLVTRHHERGGAAASGREVFDRAGDGDAVAAAVIEEVGRDVALALVALIAVVDPRLVVLAGGIGAQPMFLRAVREALPTATPRPVDVVASALGDRAALLGAIALAAGVLDERGTLHQAAAGGSAAEGLGVGREDGAPATTWYAREVQEQPRVVERVVADAPERLRTWLAQVAPELPFLLLARGTSDHAATYGRYLLAQLAGRDALLAVPSLTTVHDRDPARRAAVVGISQSGRSPDIVQVMQRGASLGWPTLAIVNDPSSPLAMAAESVLDLGCGPERSVAATKSYTASLAALAALAVEAAPERDRDAWWAELQAVPDHLARALSAPLPEESVAVLAAAERVLVTGRGVNLATAQELALKLQETTGTMAQAWSPADLLHGPVAAAGPATPVVAVAPPDAHDPSVLEACQQARRRGSPLVVLGDGPPDAITVATPRGVPAWLTPLSTIVTGQRLVGAVAARRGTDVDRPGGLQKVTETT